jgi:LPXTG-motif cell wall-anchored protein
MPDQDAANPNNSANRESLPSTAAGWLTMLWAGGALSGAGLMLRRKR